MFCEVDFCIYMQVLFLDIFENLSICFLYCVYFVKFELRFRDGFTCSYGIDCMKYFSWNFIIRACIFAT